MQSQIQSGSMHLNEEKNGGGVENEHNRELFYSKWNFAEPDGQDEQNQYGRSSPGSCGTAALNPPPGLRALYESVMLDPTDLDAFKSFIRESYSSRCFKPARILPQRASENQVQFEGAMLPACFLPFRTGKI